MKDSVVRILSQGGGRPKSCRYFNDHLASGDILVFQIARISLDVVSTLPSIEPRIYIPLLPEDNGREETPYL